MSKEAIPLSEGRVDAVVIGELEKLAQDLYSEGYQCGISGADSDKWFKAWAMAMQKVATGEKYTESDLVIKCFEEI